MKKKEIKEIIILVENVINEIGELPPQVGGTPQTPQVNNTQQTPIDATVKRYNSAVNSSSSVGRAAQGINRQQQFPNVFKSWFSTLGYTPKNGTVTIANTLRAVTKAMTDLGYK